MTQLDLNGRTVLITGGAGFIGSNLALSVERQFPKCRVIVADAFVLGHFQNLRGFRGECLAADIASEQDLKQLAGLRFDYLFHQAAISDTTVADQQLMVRVNTNASPGAYSVTTNCEGQRRTVNDVFTVIGGVRGGLGGSSSSGATPTDIAIGGGLVAAAAIGGGVFWMRRRSESKI